jgi:hypothetical protein
MFKCNIKTIMLIYTGITEHAQDKKPILVAEFEDNLKK